MGDAENSPSPWIGREGDLAHPNAAAGGGGDGKFKRAGALGGDGNDADPVRHPQSPSARVDGLSAPETVQLDSPGVKITDVKRNPPPATAPGVVHTIKSGNHDISVEVLADGTTTSSGAKTNLDGTGLAITFPEFESSTAKPDVVDKLKGVYSVKGKVTIQVLYGSDAKAADGAAWGRGTTSSDITAMDTTVGFHESCHMADFKAAMKKPFPPAFGGKVGQKTTDYDAECTKTENAIEQFFKDAEAASRTNTDETGTKMSDYVKTHAGVTGH